MSMTREHFSHFISPVLDLFVFKTANVSGYKLFGSSSRRCVILRVTRFNPWIRAAYPSVEQR